MSLGLALRFTFMLLVLAGCSVSDRVGLRVADAGDKPAQATSGVCAAGSCRTEDDAGPAAADGGVDQSMPASCRAGECWWSATQQGCRSAGAPNAQERPSASDGVDDERDLYFALSKVWLGESSPVGDTSPNAWRTFGLDLDGLCTNSDGCGSSDRPCRSPTSQIAYDGELCRDNTFASLMPFVAGSPDLNKRFGLSESEINCSLWNGAYNIVLKVSGYNGGHNDPHVRLDMYVSTGLVQPRAWQCPVEQLSDYPLWRESAAWKIDLTDSGKPVTTAGSLPDSIWADADAYVRDDYLVASLPDGGLLRLAADGKRSRGFAFQAKQLLWTGRLTRAADERWYMHDGLIAGRVSTAELLKGFRRTGLCPDEGLDALYMNTQELIEQSADLLLDGSRDASRPCDAMSFGVGFESAQITAGPEGSAPPLVECCAPGIALSDCDPKCGDGRKNGKEKCDTAIAAGQPGACPRACAALDACTPQVLKGSDCDAECVAMPVTAVGPKDGCCPAGADSTSDPDCVAVCGNGVLEKGETCDPKETCLDCTVNDSCLMVTKSGSAERCTIACSFTAIAACKNDDGCCPLGCTPNNDADCSSACGNGKIDEHETCDSMCPSSCDDHDDCTQDLQTGSASTCNITCTHIRITQAVSGDKCCPEGASANTDADCSAKCGNKKVEGSEQCDDGNTKSGDGCSADCKNETQSDQCIQAFMPAGPECARCSCEKCNKEVLACYAGKDSNVNKLCTNVVACGLQRGCAGTISCYCRAGGVANCTEGPCRSEIEASAGSTILLDISVRAGDTSYPFGRANALTTCMRTNCSSDCGL